MTNPDSRAIIAEMRYVNVLYITLLIITGANAADAENRIPLFYVKDTAGNSDAQKEVYSVYDVSPALGTVLVDNGGEMIWIDGARVKPNKGGAIVALLEGAAPDAEWAMMGGGAIPYRRSGKYAWFARAAFAADLEPFFPGDEIIGLVEKHKLYRGGVISPEAETYIAVIDDDFIGDICRSIAYDTFDSARGYDTVSLNILEGSGESLLLIEDTSCRFRVSSYDWRRSGIADFFRYRDGELHHDGFAASAVEVGIGNVVGGVTSDFFIDEKGRLYQRRTAYVDIVSRNGRFTAESQPLGFETKRGEITPKRYTCRDMIEGKTRDELKLYKLPDDEIPPIDTVPPDTPLDLLVYFPADIGEESDWYLVEGEDIVGNRKYIGWARTSELIILK